MTDSVLVGLSFHGLSQLLVTTATREELVEHMSIVVQAIAIREETPLVEVVEAMLACAVRDAAEFEAQRAAMRDELATVTAEWDQLRAANAEAHGV